MTENSLSVKKRERYLSRAIPLLATGLGMPKRQVEAGAWLMLADAISFLLATLVASTITIMTLPLPDLSALALIDGLSLPLFLVSCLAIGLYKDAGTSMPKRLRLRFYAIMLFIAAKLFLSALLGSINTELLATGIQSVLLLPAGVYMEILVRHHLMADAPWGAPTLVVGTDDRARSIFEHLSTQPELGLRPVGHLSAINNGITQITVSGPGKPIDAGAAGVENRVEAIVITHPNQYHALSSIKSAELAGCRIFTAFNGDMPPSLSLQTLSLGSNVGVKVQGGLQLARSRRLKRAIDIAIAAPALLLGLPIIAAMMIAMKVIDPGPALYIQKRIGLRGRPISVFKIRSMYIDAEQRLEEHLSPNPAARKEWERFCKLRDDPRVLPGIGRFIRRSSLDELPQLWNVLRGDMSIVGPRPLPAYHLERFDAGFTLERQSVPPGLTGLWQVSSRSNGDIDLQQAQDLLYIRNWSLWLDLYILLKTPIAVLNRNGAF